MREFRPSKIVVGTDFSPSATAALDAAKVFARKFQSEIILVYGYGMTPVGVAEFAPFYDPQIDEELRRESEQQMRDYAAQHLAGSAHQTVVIDDTAVNAIIRTAEEEGAEMIAVGTHGRTGFRLLVLGSVAEGVLRRARIPVLTVREGTTLSMRRVFCPVTSSAMGGYALDCGSSLAHSFESRLVIAEVFENAAHSVEHVELLDNVTGDVLDRAEYTSFSLRGNRAAELERFATGVNATFVVLGAYHGRLVDTSVIRTNAQAVVRHCQQPVLTVSAPLIAVPASFEAARAMRVSEVMTREPITCSADRSVADVAAIMRDARCGAVPLFESSESKRVIGVLTDRDIACRVAATGRDARGVTARDIMSTPPITISPASTLDRAIELIERHQVWRLPVAGTNGECIGMLSVADIVAVHPSAMASALVRDVGKPEAVQ